MSLASSPKQIKVTFNDVEDDTTGGQKKRAKVKPPSADAKPNWAQAAGLDPYDKDTLFQAVDQNGPYPRGPSGTIEPEAFCRFRRTIGRHAYTVFLKIKEELMEERMTYLKRKMMKEYAELVEVAADKYRETVFNVTKLAAEYIGLDQQSFQASL